MNRVDLFVLLCQPSKYQRQVWTAALESQGATVKHADLSSHPITQLTTLQQEGVKVGLMLTEMLMLKNPFEFCRGCKAAFPDLPIVLTRSKQASVLEPERRWASHQGVQDLLTGFSDQLSLQELVEKLDQLLSSVCRNPPHPNAITQRLLVNPIVQQLLGRGQNVADDSEPTLVLATSGIFKSDASGRLSVETVAPPMAASGANSDVSQTRSSAMQDPGALSQSQGLGLSAASVSPLAPLSNGQRNGRSSKGTQSQSVKAGLAQPSENDLLTTKSGELSSTTASLGDPALAHGPDDLILPSQIYLSGFQQQALKTMGSTCLVAPNEFLRNQLENPLGKRLVEAGLLHPTQVNIILEDQRHQPGLLFGELLLLKGWLEEQPCWFFINLGKVATCEEFHHLPIGQKLKLAGLVNDQQIDKVLHRQQQARMPFGKLLFQQGFLKLKTVEYFARL